MPLPPRTGKRFVAEEFRTVGVTDYDDSIPTAMGEMGPDDWDDDVIDPEVVCPFVFHACPHVLLPWVLQRQRRSTAEIAAEEAQQAELLMAEGDEEHWVVLEEEDAPEEAFVFNQQQKAAETATEAVLQETVVVKKFDRESWSPEVQHCDICMKEVRTILRGTPQLGIECLSWQVAGAFNLPPTRGLINQPCVHKACQDCFKTIVQAGRAAVCPLCKAREEEMIPPSQAKLERSMDEGSIWNQMRQERIARIDSLTVKTEAVISMVANPPDVEYSHKRAVLPPGAHDALYYNQSSTHDFLSKDWNFKVTL